MATLGEAVIYTAADGTEALGTVLNVRDDDNVDLVLFKGTPGRAPRPGEPATNRPLTITTSGVANVPYDQSGEDGTFRSIA